MSNLSAKFASALVLGTVAGAVSTALPPSMVHAADNCLQAPKDTAPQGKHWHYRLEHRTGHKCWYLRGEDETSSAAAGPATSDTPAPRRAQASASRSIADAHAEIVPRTSGADDAPAAEPAPPAWPDAAAAAPAATTATASAAAPATEPSPLASRWPQSADAAPAANPQPKTPLTVADADDGVAAPTQETTPQPPAIAAAPVERNDASIQKLLIVAGGALALAGLTGSAVYRLGRRRRHNDWVRERSEWQPGQNLTDPPWVESQSMQTEPGLSDLDDSHTALHEEASSAFGAAEPGDHIEKIEAFLARLTEQLHTELESMPRTGKDARAVS